jgi:hypothetical protein
MYTDQTTNARQRSGLLAKRGTKRSLLISGVFFIAVLVMIGASGTTLFGPHGKAKADGPSITTQQCHDDGNNQVVGNSLGALVDEDQAGSWAHIGITLLYCPAWDSFFGRFIYDYPTDYVLNQDALPKGYCYIESTQDNDSLGISGLLGNGSVRSGCTESSDVNAGVPDGAQVDTQITANDGYQWRACWVSTTSGAPGDPFCTDWAAANASGSISQGV